MPDTEEDPGWALKATSFLGNVAWQPLYGIYLFYFGFSPLLTGQPP